MVVSNTLSWIVNVPLGVGRIMTEHAAGGSVSTDEVIHSIVAKTPAGRLGKPADVAATVVFLPSPEAAFVTGQVINVCGGHSANMP